VARHVKFLAFGVLALALPATASTFGFPAAAPQTCLAIGGVTWRVATGSADLTVRIDRAAAAAPDVRIRLTDTPDAADFVFVDDGAPSGCLSDARSIKISATAAAPDLTIGFASDAQAANYRVYVRSRRLSPEAVAALFAAAQMPPRKLAARAE
jgi:hypothetical protein